jgi:outer membrane protein OmpA-like peptidoglycan-associated protein
MLRRLGVLVGLCVVGLPASARADAVLVADVDPLAFGDVRVGTPVTADVTLTNVGVDDANVTSLAITGGPTPGDFSVVTGTPLVITALGGSEIVTVQFTPAESGARGATLTIGFDPPASSTLDVGLTGNGIEPIIGVAPDPLTFAARRVGTTSSSQTVTISNTGTDDLEVTGIAKTAGDTADFLLTTSLPMTIPPGMDGTFSVAFSPTDAGARSATVSITSDAPGSPTTMTVSGFGEAPVLSVSPGSLSFPNTPVGAMSATQSFTIDNTGDSDMNVLSVAIPGANADDYIVTPFSATIAPSDPPVTIDVTFNPQLMGAQPATVVVTTDNPLAPATANVSLTGTGTRKLLSLTPAAGFSYGNVRVGSASSNGVFVLENTGNATLTVSGLTLGGATPGQFSLISPPGTPFTIGAGATRNITVRCTPTSTGAKSATFVVTSDADNAGSVPIPPLACNGVTPEIAVTPLSLTYADQLVGTTSPAQTFTVSNAAGTFSTTLNVTITKSGANPGNFNVSPSSFSVAPGGSQIVSATFTPSAEGARSATIAVNSDDLDEPTTNVSASGNGVKPEITLVLPGGGSIDFGDVNVSASSTPSTVRVRNDGSSNLTISSVSIIGSGASHYSIVSGTIPPPSVVIAPGGTAAWDVVFTPSSTGTKNATFRIINDDASEGTLDVPLTGVGIQAQLTVSPSPISFPVTRVCETASPITVTVRNSGTADLTVSDLTVTPTAIFPIETMWPSLPRTLGPNESFTFALGFVPAMHSDYSGTVTIISDAPGAGTSIITILGPGRVTDMGLTPMSVAFGDVRVDEPPVSRTFLVKNTGTADFVLGGASVDATANFTVNPLSPSSLPTTLSPAPAGPGGTGEEALIEIIAHPGSIGPASGTITLTTDIPSCMPIVATIPVGAEGVAPDMLVTPTSLDYEGHDVQAEFPKTAVVTIENTGSAPLEVDALTITGTFANEFGLIDPPALPLTIPVGGTLDLDVAFQPGLMRDCNPADPDAFVDVESDGYTVPMARVQLDGCGLDRIISLSTMALPFPPTYRNPADPETLDIVVENTGTFKLEVYATATSDLDVFRVVGGGPQTLLPEETRTLTVEFHPTAASAIPFDGQLVISNDDDMNDMASIALTGRGILPEVVCDPCNVAFGGTAIGSRARLPGPKVRINNMNATRPFTVRELLVVDDAGDPIADDVFEVLGFKPGTVIQPLSGLDVDVAFSPDAAGGFDARLEVFIDEDPLVTTFISLSGEGIGARARGYGCDVGAGAGGAGGGALVLALVALALALSTRRRWAALLAAVLATGLAAAPAVADPTRNVDLDTFRPAGGGDPGMITVDTPSIGAPGTWSLAVFLDYARRPLGIEPDGPGGMSYPIENRTVTELAFDYVLGARYEVGGRLPFLSQSGDERMLNVDPASGTSIGDLAVRGKAVAVDGAMLGLAGLAVLTLPTAADDEFAGVNGPSLHAQAAASVRAWKLHIAANGGIRLRKRAQFLDVTQDDELTYGLGVGYRATRRTTVVGELFGASGIGDAQTAGSSPLEWALGARYRMARSFSVTTGFGSGILPGLGTPQIRGFVLFAYTPGASDLPAAKVEPRRIVDRRDDDDDGIINSDDKCPHAAEDADDFEDDDGCPEIDNDEDGIADALDDCPLQAEDKDGFQDDDGCPDEDNDGDGIPDVDDECPDEVEDMDGYRDQDGCDDPDNDRDGVPDVIDQCALEPETINGIEDDDGCPDDGDSAIIESDDRIELIEPIQFRGAGAQLAAGSENVLGQVGSLLRARPEWTTVRIGVHVHPRGAKDEALSKQRAEAVKKWLVDRGVDADRLVIMAHGSDRPLVPKNARKAQSINERVEFVVEKKRDVR